VARIGHWGPGRTWVDDAAIERVADDTPVTDAPVLGPEEAALEPPGPLETARAVRCGDCGYRNMPAWGHCYACGAELAEVAGRDDGLPPVKPLTSFEPGQSRTFAEGTVVAEHATDGEHALRVDQNWSSWDGELSFAGYDLFKVDVFNPSDDPQPFYFEVRDRQTTDYWTRVNYNSVVPPGASTMVIPTDLYVGEKSRPGRPLDKAHITRVVLSLGGGPGPLYFDQVRLEQDLSDSVQVPGLQAFDFTPGTAPPFRGFTAITPSTLYSPGRGYGLKDARIWRAYDMLQPDPLYATLLCVEQGGWPWTCRTAPGRSGSTSTAPRDSGASIRSTGSAKCWPKGCRWSTRPWIWSASGGCTTVSGMSKTGGRRHFRQVPESVLRAEREFDVEVRDGQLNVEFQGANWAHCVSALVAYPADTPAQRAAGGSTSTTCRSAGAGSSTTTSRRSCPTAARTRRA